MASDEVTTMEPRDKIFLSSLFVLQVLVSVVLSYQVLFATQSLFTVAEQHWVILALLGVSALVYLVPQSLSAAPWFLLSLVFFDAFASTAIIYFSNQEIFALSLVYFLILLIAGLSHSLKQTLVFCVVLGASYSLFVYLQRGPAGFQNEADLLAIPVLLVMGSFYGAASERVHAQRQHTAQLQEQLQHAQKMEALGRMAAGVVHEINTPLGFVKGNLEVLARYLDRLTTLLKRYERLENPSDSSVSAQIRGDIRQMKEAVRYEHMLGDLRPLMEQTYEGIERIRKITQSLKEFSHAGRSPSYTDVNRCLQSALTMVRHEVKKAKIIEEYGVVPEIVCVPVELHQVFANLLINAAQAVRDHGQIKISTSRQNGTIVIEIADNGCGIEERHLPRIFEPFFTTKPIGTGRGLGLSISSAIVEQLNGRIEVASKAGTGTTVRVCLPVQVPRPTTVASGSTLSSVQRSTMNQPGEGTS